MGFEIGDFVQIREWEDMLCEFGSSGTLINCRFQFTKDMSYLCGKTFTITNITGNKVFGAESLMTGLQYNISTDMIKLINDNEFVVDDEASSAIDEFLIDFIK